MCSYSLREAGQREQSGGDVCGPALEAVVLMSAMPVCGAVVLSQEVEGLEEPGWGGVCFVAVTVV